MQGYFMLSVLMPMASAIAPA